MNGSGPAGEATFDDVRARLAAVTGRLAAIDAGHDGTAAEVAALRQAAADALTVAQDVGADVPAPRADLPGPPPA